MKQRSDLMTSWVKRTILWRIWERLLENEFLERSVALGAKAFVSFFPALIVVAAFLPSSVRTSILEVITRRIGVHGAGEESIRGAFNTTDNVRRATGVVGLLFTFFYINSFTSALTRVYVRAWRRPPASRLAGYGIGAAWLLGVVVYFSILGALRVVLGNGPRTAIFGVLALAAAIGIWWVTPWLMLQRQVKFRALAATALLTGTAVAVYAATSSIWMPRTVSTNQNQFGFFGVTLALVTWLTGFAMIVVTGACTAPVLAEDSGPIGRLIRGPSQSVLAEEAVPSLPPPVRAPTLTDAIGLGQASDDGAAERIPDRE